MAVCGNLHESENLSGLDLVDKYQLCLPNEPILRLFFQTTMIPNPGLRCLILTFRRLVAGLSFDPRTGAVVAR